MKKTALTFGLIAGVIIFVYSFIVFVIFGDFDTMTQATFKIVSALGYLRYLILIIAIFLAMRAFKNEASDLNYMKMVKTGVMVALVVAIFIGIGEFAYILFNPDFMDKYSNLMIRGLQEEGASPEKIMKFKQEMETFNFMRNPYFTGIFYFFETLIIGTVISFIFGIFIRPKKTVNIVKA